MLSLVTGQTFHKSTQTESHISAQQAVQIKKAFSGEIEHCLLARICSTHFWEGSKFQYMHNFFWFFLPQMIHYMTVNQEPGVEWSLMPLHMHTSTAQHPSLPRHLPPLHRIQEIWMCRAVLSPWCQRWLNPEACNSKTHLGDAEWRRNGRSRVEGICFHASINMFCLLDKCILMHMSAIKQNTRQADPKTTWGRKNVNIFSNTMSLFKRSINFLFASDSKTNLSYTHWSVLFYPLWGWPSVRGSQGWLRLARMWWDGDKYPTLPRINNPERNHNGEERGSDWTRKQNKTKKETRPGSKVSISCPRLFACHLLDMIITTEQGRRGLSRPHLYQQAGIKLSNYPPRPLAWPLTLLTELVPFASLACSQTLQAGMWKHILMTALFQSQVFVIALGSLCTLCGTSPTQQLEGQREV